MKIHNDEHVTDWRGSRRLHAGQPGPATPNRRTMMMPANSKAAALKTALFNLITEFKDFAATIHNAPATNLDSKMEAHGQADQAACGLANVYDCMAHDLDLFFDESRDAADQTFTFPV